MATAKRENELTEVATSLELSSKIMNSKKAAASQSKVNSNSNRSKRGKNLIADVPDNLADSDSNDDFGTRVSGIQSTVFDPLAPEIVTSWSSYASTIFCINTYQNGLTLSVHTNEPQSESESAILHTPEALEAPASLETERALQSTHKFAPQQFHLRFRDTRDYQLPLGKYFLHRENYAKALEGHFSHLHKSGTLGSSVVYFGTTTDPFLSLHKKFDLTMACMELLERYVPGLVVFQTRSPMVISVLPALKALAEKAVVAMPIETISEKAIARYTPGKPRIGERLIAADGLRKQGIKVNLIASPILPYGDPKRDAWDFAEVLERHADYVTFGSLASGLEADEKQLKNLPIAQRLAADQQFFWLRPHCYQHVFQAVKAIAPDKLLLPVKRPVNPGQLNLFAA